MKESEPQNPAAHSRRDFLKSLGTIASTTALTQVNAAASELEKANAEKIVGPGAVPVTLTVNGTKLKLLLEPRVTLLDALRNYSSYTGPKEGCDRASCGACTVLIDDKPVYSCQRLAIDSQGVAITTIEGVGRNDRLSKVQQAFIDADASQCGYCTPGFVMSVTALLKWNPRPTAAEVKHACSGNLCRCGAHPHIIQAALKAAGVEHISKTEVVNG